VCQPFHVKHASISRDREPDSCNGDGGGRNPIPLDWDCDSVHWKTGSAGGYSEAVAGLPSEFGWYRDDARLDCSSASEMTLLARGTLP
jgi:hypothetical protein